MRLTLLLPVASPWGTAPAGGVLDVPDETGAKWVSDGVAVVEAVAPEPPAAVAPIKTVDRDWAIEDARERAETEIAELRDELIDVRIELVEARAALEAAKAETPEPPADAEIVELRAELAEARAALEKAVKPSPVRTPRKPKEKAVKPPPAETRG